MIQEPMKEDTTSEVDIRPFHVDIPEEALVDPRRCIVATEWPERETVVNPSAPVTIRGSLQQDKAGMHRPHPGNGYRPGSSCAEQTLLPLW